MNNDEVVSQFKKMQYTIVILGWDNLVSKSFASNNIRNVDMDLFNIYRDIYEEIKKLITIDEHSDAIVLDKFNEIQHEILLIGWDGILKKYHPDINMVEQAMDIFTLYKEIYNSILMRVMNGGT